MTVMNSKVKHFRKKKKKLQLSIQGCAHEVSYSKFLFNMFLYTVHITTFHSDLNGIFNG